MKFEYAIVVLPLSEEDGGGFVAKIPDLDGCMGDGETPEEAIIDVQNAAIEWLHTAEKRGMDVPQPGASAENFSNYVHSLESKLTTAMNIVESYQGMDVEIDQLKAAIRLVADAVTERDAWLKKPMDSAADSAAAALPLKLGFAEKTNH